MPKPVGMTRLSSGWSVTSASMSAQRSNPAASAVWYPGKGTREPCRIRFSLSSIVFTRGDVARGDLTRKQHLAKKDAPGAKPLPSTMGHRALVRGGSGHTGPADDPGNRSRQPRAEAAPAEEK